MDGESDSEMLTTLGDIELRKGNVQAEALQHDHRRYQRSQNEVYPFGDLDLYHEPVA